MTDSRHRKVDRKQGVKVRSKQGRRRSSGVDQPLSREELKVAAQADRARRARRRIAWAVGGALVIVWSAVIFSFWLGQRTTTDDPQTPIGEVPSEGVSALFAVLNSEGRTMSIALLAASEDGNDRVAMLHPSLLVTIPGFGENLVSNAELFDGPALLGTTVSNLLGVRIDEVVVWTAASLQAAITEPILIDLPEPLIVADGTAQLVIAGTGPIARDGAAIARLLVDKGLGDDLDLLQRQGAVWSGLLDRGGVDEAFIDRLVAGAGAAARSALVGVSTGDPVLTIVPATRIEPSGRVERYQLDGRDAAAFAAAHISYLQLAQEPRVRVEVLNGNGTIGTTRPVAALLVDAGFRIVVTDNADRSDYPTTLIIAQGRNFQQAALSVREVIGLGDVSMEIRQPSGVVDVTIIVGQDLPAGGEG